MFEEMTTQEIALVSGGDRWAGTPDGRAPCPWIAMGLAGSASLAQASADAASAADASLEVKLQSQSC